MRGLLIAAGLVVAFGAPSVRASPGLDSAIHGYDSLDSGQRASLVQVLTLLKDRQAGTVVRRCLRTRGAELPTCIVAAARLMMASTAPLLRQVIRDSSDPLALSLAARTLGRWGDKHSADLLLWAMATRRGAPQATPHLLQGWLTLNPKHESRYLRWLWTSADAGSTRQLEFALRLISRTHSAVRLADQVRQQLLAAWESWRRDPSALPDALALRVAWGLFSDPRGCRIMFARLELKQGNGRRDPLIQRLNRSRCRPFRPRDQPFAPDHRAPLPSLPEWSRKTPSTPTPARWQGILNGMGLDEPRGAERLAAAQAKFRGADDWNSVLAWHRARRPARYVVKGVRDLERHYASLPMPADDQPEVGVTQPSWWPDTILLTIDDGPRPSMLSPLLDTLEVRGVKVVFFVVASQLIRAVVEQPVGARQLLERMAREGHQIGFHSMNHLIRLGKHLLWRERDQIADSVRAFRQIIVQTTKHPWPVLLARLPGAQGRLHSWVNAGLKDGGTGPHMHWELGGHGWGQRTGLKQIRKIARQACRRHERGWPSRVLLHESARSARQVAAFIDEIQRRCPQSPADVAN